VPTTQQVAEESIRIRILEEERSELDAFASTLSNSSRLLRLLTYIGDKYFQGETEKLREYDIATEVFGRSKSMFNPGEDAIVRVEAHRLRKRLKKYYEGEGKDHAIQLSLPPGSYAPVFTRCQQESEDRAEPPPAAPDLPRPPRRRWWIYVAAVVVLLLIAAGVVAVFHRNRIGKSPIAKAGPAASSPAPPNVGPYAQVPLRILAGYSGKPQVDSSGAVWLSDRYDHFGGNWAAHVDSVERTSNPMLFEHRRNGDFSYDIPLRPGKYELHLYFLDYAPNAGTPSTFSVDANGKPLLSEFDIETDAMGANIADERVFRDISPGPNGRLQLVFSSLMAPAELNAIKILPGLPHKQLPIRIVARPTSFTDHKGQFWHPDNYFHGGYASEKHAPVSGTPDPDLYAGERFGNFSYTIPFIPWDRYTLILHFAELYFGPHAPGGGGVGSRVFRVLCNGQTLLDNFDIYKQVGSFHALTETFHHLKPTPQGKLNITFQPIVNNATVSAIEVIDESK
jgi:hypothetical protein